MIDKAKDSFTKGIENDSSFPLPAKFKERILNEIKENNQTMTINNNR